MPFHIASNGSDLLRIHRLIIQNGVDGLAQVSAIQGLVVARSAAVELAAVTKAVWMAFCLGEQIKLRGAGCLKSLGKRLFLIHQVWEAPAVTCGLIRQLIGAILGVRDQAVAADAHHLNDLSKVLFQAREFRFNVFDKRAV
jgi:hypothetical protein